MLAGFKNARVEKVPLKIRLLRQRERVATARRSYGGPSEKFAGGFGGNFQKLPTNFSAE